MPTVHIHASDATVQSLHAKPGTTLMQAAVSAGLAGIIGECGGAGMCATCHVYVDAAWAGLLPGVAQDEDDMLDCTASERRAGSRLSCQIRLSDALDGLVVLLPEQQL